MSTFLLERARVTDENPFHIITLLRQHDESGASERFDQVRAALDGLGIPSESQDKIWGMLRGIDCLIKGDDAAAAACFGVDAYALHVAINVRTVNFKNDSISKPRKGDELRAAQHGLVRSLYVWLFEWVVQQINMALGAPSLADPCISLVDIFGFESFEQKNTLAQFLINWANEQLLCHLSKDMLEHQADVYAAEDIEVDRPPSFPSCLSLIAGLPGSLGKPGQPGISSLLDDETRRLGLGLGGTDAGFASNVAVECVDLPGYTRSKSAYEFKIEHYAGDVAYDTRGFLAANSERVDDKLLDLLASCGEFVAELVRDKVTPKGTRRDPFSSVVTSFRQSILKLDSLLAQTRVHYVHCIKPNEQSKPRIFEKPRVAAQMEATGVAHISRFARAHGPYRVPRDAMPCYALLVGCERTDLHATVSALNSLAGDADGKGVQLGTRHVFFRMAALQKVENALKPKLVALVGLQTSARTFLARSVFLRKRAAAIRIQSVTRGHQARADFQVKLAAAREARRIAAEKVAAEAAARAAAEAEAKAQAEAEARRVAELEARQRAEEEAAKAQALAQAAREAEVASASSHTPTRDHDISQDSELAYLAGDESPIPTIPGLPTVAISAPDSLPLSPLSPSSMHPNREAVVTSTIFPTPLETPFYTPSETPVPSNATAPDPCSASYFTDSKRQQLDESFDAGLHKATSSHTDPFLLDYSRSTRRDSASSMSSSASGSSAFGELDETSSSIPTSAAHFDLCAIQRDLSGSPFVDEKATATLVQGLLENATLYIPATRVGVILGTVVAWYEAEKLHYVPDMVTRQFMSIAQPGVRRMMTLSLLWSFAALVHGFWLQLPPTHAIAKQLERLQVSTADLILRRVYEKAAAAVDAALAPDSARKLSAGRPLLDTLWSDMAPFPDTVRDATASAVVDRMFQHIIARVLSRKIRPDAAGHVRRSLSWVCDWRSGVGLRCSPVEAVAVKILRTLAHEDDEREAAAAALNMSTSSTVSTRSTASASSSSNSFRKTLRSLLATPHRNNPTEAANLALSSFGYAQTDLQSQLERALRRVDVEETAGDAADGLDRVVSDKPVSGLLAWVGQVVDAEQ